ncbi:hypothetical protein DVH24_009001 [Malus domestica]|uniref:Uncharacterized protein n=1 Tax=Malus domestica TaxID=3750 RepID=A0A498JNN2_MALDO|nr:hypothetical protein DVH24_009001 [Malus domestica]
MTGLRPILGVSLRPSNEARSPSPCVTCHIPARTRLHHSTILSALGPDHTLTVLFLGIHTRTSQWVTHHGIALARTRLTSEFRQNPKPRCEYTYKAYKIHSPMRCGMLQFIPLRGPTSSSTHIRPGIGYDTKLSHPGPTPTTSRA